MHLSPRNRGTNFKRAIITIRNGTLGTLVLKVNVFVVLAKKSSTHVQVVYTIRLGDTLLIIINLVNAVGPQHSFDALANEKASTLGKEGHPQLMMKLPRLWPKKSKGRTMRKGMKICSHQLYMEDLNLAM